MKKMTREEFTNACIDAGGWSHSNKFEVEWTMGGTYANYLGDISAASPEPEPEFDSLETFLENNFPEMTFMQFRSVMRSVEKGDTEHADYYGGSTSEGYKRISFDQLATSLETLGLLLIIDPKQV